MWLTFIIFIYPTDQRRVENTRRVRFAEEVTIVPPLVVCDDEGDVDDEEHHYGQNSSEINIDHREESASRQSVPRWIEALRSKTKRKPKLKLPRMRGKKYRFVWQQKTQKQKRENLQMLPSTELHHNIITTNVWNNSEVKMISKFKSFIDQLIHLVN